MDKPLISIQPMPGDLLTAYTPGGSTRSHSGATLPDDRVTTVSNAPHQGRWKGTPGSNRAWVALDKAWQEDGGAPLRLTDGLRSNRRQRELRIGYDEWVRAGRPPRRSPGWRTWMHDAFVAPPNGSQHGWGGARDFSVSVLHHNRLGTGTDEALARLWQLMEPLGWTPIIREPMVAQSESWHLDRFGVLGLVKDKYRSHGRAAYTRTAEVGCLLTGTYAGDWLPTRRLQATLALLDVLGLIEPDVFVGAADGIIGGRTRANIDAMVNALRDVGAIGSEDTPPIDRLADMATDLISEDADALEALVDL